MLSLALYHPDMPQNFGAMLRLAACMGLELHVIEPCGFPLDHKRIRRSGMDYVDHVALMRHVSWGAFLDFRQGVPPRRLILLSTKGADSYADFAFQPGDILLLGSESSGVDAGVPESMDAVLRIPVKAGMRSLNVVTAAAMVAGEALRQMKGFPHE